MSFAAALDRYLDARDALRDANDRSAGRKERADLFEAFGKAMRALDDAIGVAATVGVNASSKKIGKKAAFTPVARKR